MDTTPYISSNCAKQYERFGYEILLETNETLLQTSDPLVRKNILNIKQSNLYQDLKFHQEIMKGFFYFNDLDFLKKYLIWRYRVYHYRGIDTAYLPKEASIWFDVMKRFIEYPAILPLQKLYDWIIFNHNHFNSELTLPSAILSSDLDEQLFLASLEYSSEHFYHLSEPHCGTLLGFADFFSIHIQKISRFVGYQWEINLLSVAKEHLATSNIEGIAFRLLANYPIQSMKNKTILLAGAQGEYHSLGMKIAAIMFEKLGYRVINLGANTPKKDLMNLCYELLPDVIIVSASLYTSLSFVAETIEELQTIKNEKEILLGIGGGGLDGLSNPLEKIKADLHLRDFNDLMSYFG